MITKRIYSACLFVLIAVFLALSLPVAGVDNPNYRRFEDAKSLRVYMKWHPKREPLISAHRGGPMRGYPENAVESFENVLNYGPCLIECDVRLSRDGHLVMMHDSTLDRTTTGKGKVSDFSLARLKQLFLKDPGGQITRFRIPTLGEVLEWSKGRAVLSVDVKRDVPFHRVVDAVRKHKAGGHAVIITYSLEDTKKVHQLAPELMISASAGSIKGVDALLAGGVPPGNLCVFVGGSEPEPAVYKALHEKDIRAILGTMHNLDNRAAARGFQVYRQLYRNGADILATDNAPLVSQAIKEMKKQE
jgi:glycerophosphoryl diester phosphodiesterase